MSVVVMYVCKKRRATAWQSGISHTCLLRCPLMCPRSVLATIRSWAQRRRSITWHVPFFFSATRSPPTSCIHHGEKKAGPQVWRSETLAQPQRYQTVRLMHSHIENTIRKSRLWLKQARKRAKSGTRNSLRHPCSFSTMPPWDRPTAFWWIPTLLTSASRIRSSSFRG